MTYNGRTADRVREGTAIYSRILIVDDHADVRRALKALLERHPDWNVCAEAGNGLEAVQKAAELKPDLVVVDLQMPGIGGLEAARRISLTTPGVPILLYTVCDFPLEFKLEARKVGVWDVIHKNTSPEQLVSAVQASLDRRV